MRKTFEERQAELRERRLRKKASRIGYQLKKSRASISLGNFGDFMLVDAYTNCVILGSRFDLTLDGVEEWLSK